MNAGSERVRRAEELLRLWPTPEEHARMSDEEKQKLAVRMRAVLSRMAEASKEWDSVEQEEPIEPIPPPQNN